MGMTLIYSQVNPDGTTEVVFEDLLAEKKSQKETPRTPYPARDEYKSPATPSTPCNDPFKHPQ